MHAAERLSILQYCDKWVYARFSLKPMAVFAMKRLPRICQEIRVLSYNPTSLRRGGFFICAIRLGYAGWTSSRRKGFGDPREGMRRTMTFWEAVRPKTRGSWEATLGDLWRNRYLISVLVHISVFLVRAVPGRLPGSGALQTETNVAIRMDIAGYELLASGLSICFPGERLVPQPNLEQPIEP